jgi:hypothetical protein
MTAFRHRVARIRHQMPDDFFYLLTSDDHRS